MRPPPLQARRWSGSAWLLLREEARGSNLAPGGTLGGSQAGVRLLYRLNGDAARPFAIAARLSAPLRDRDGSEGAIGLDWRPIAQVPLHILAERRLRLGGTGRSGFALTAYGGRSGRLPGGIVADSYVQAGIVGLRTRDLFVDGAVRVALPAGRAEIGASAWGAAQPGAARLDAGPQVSLRVPVGRTALRLSADWRFRIVGNARPASGPAVALSTDF